MGWVSAETMPDSYAKAYDLFSNIATAMGNAYEETVGDHSVDLEYDDPTNLSLILFMPFLSLDMAFTSMLDEEVDDYVVQTVFSMFGRDDVVLTRAAPHEYILAYTGTDWYEVSKDVELLCVFSPSTGSIRYSRRDNGVLMDFQELVPLGGDRYALQNGNQRAVVSYVNGVVDAFTFSYVPGEMLPNFRSAMVYDLERDGIYPNAPGMDEAWVTERDDLRQNIRLDASALSIKGTDLFGAEKDVVIQR